MRLMMAMSAVAVLSAAAGPATADWEYTRWSMTPEAVVAASGGKVRQVAGREGERVHDYDLVAQGDHRWRHFDLHAQFYFSPARELKVVRLTLKDNARCDAARRTLQAAHGPGGQEDLKIGDHTIMTFWHWNDEATGDFIGFTDARATARLPRMCFIRLRPAGEG